MTHSTASYTRQSHYHKSIGKQLMQDSPFHLNSESILRCTTIFQHSKKKRPRNQFTKHKLCMGKSPGERHFCFHMHNISLSWTAHSSSQCRQIHTINHTHTIYIPNLACSCLKSVPAWLTPASEKWHQHHNKVSANIRLQFHIPWLTVIWHWLTPTTHQRAQDKHFPTKFNDLSLCSLSQ